MEIGESQVPTSLSPTQLDMSCSLQTFTIVAYKLSETHTCLHYTQSRPSEPNRLAKSRIPVQPGAWGRQAGATVTDGWPLFSPSQSPVQSSMTWASQATQARSRKSVALASALHLHSNYHPGFLRSRSLQQQPDAHQGNTTSPFVRCARAHAPIPKARKVCLVLMLSNAAVLGTKWIRGEAWGVARHSIKTRRSHLLQRETVPLQLDESKTLRIPLETHLGGKVSSPTA
ncbi:hypothetical protein C8035_v007721 [Colletotrichum spinosum]|uniref:Uncharacterized protein n=1 Tax=Colletotrichum spinosum TaxID=1347390 RepID=A0A4R8QNS0_9PEZI|nr:hypothetical protein C8035_v007721 [Colletotrichum spinosum]